MVGSRENNCSPDGLVTALVLDANVLALFLPLPFLQTYLLVKSCLHAVYGYSQNWA